MSILFSRYWSHTARHYSSMECASACPCKSEDMNENVGSAGIINDDEFSSPEFIEDEEDALDWACETDSIAGSIPDCARQGDVPKIWKRCEKKSKDMEVDGGRRFLDHDSPKWVAFDHQLAQVELKKQKFIHGYFTCRSESANHQAATDRPKTRFYPKTCCSRAYMTVAKMYHGMRLYNVICDNIKIEVTEKQREVFTDALSYSHLSFCHTSHWAMQLHAD
eukprot:m.64754 g.64754  ORF g.64754 m.64754 type:complete len:221 (+) comp15899_c0_seq3:213-875(+)